jgi:hypothetical protein
MKRLLALVLSLALTPAIASAQTFTPVPAQIQLYSAQMLLQPIPCGALGFTGGAADWCTAMNTHINTYNQRLAAINQLAGIQAQVQMMMRYPQQVHGNPFQAWNGLMSVAGSAPGFYNSTYGADRSSLKTLTSSLQSQTPTQQNATISNNTQGEAGVSLAAAYQLLQADSNTAPTIANIQNAAAQAQSPLQIEQLTMQLLVMLMAQLSRMQQLSAQQLNQDASNAVLTNAQANIQQQALLQAAQAHIESAALGGNP